MSTLIVAGVLVLTIGLIIRSLIKNKHSCSHDCTSCKGCHSSTIYQSYHHDHK